MEPIINRWRGTGVIFSIFKLNITGTMIYALYIGLLFGLLTTWYIGLLSIGLFLLAESMGFGKWIGALCYPETKTDLQKEYKDKEGYNFPFIHYIANFIVNEKKDFFKYCNIALGLRGLLWGLILYYSIYNPQSIINLLIINFNYIFSTNFELVVLPNYINMFEYLIISIIYGIGFPLACYLSRKKSFNYKSKFISIVSKWETQELYYGFIHFACNAYIILKVAYGI